MNVPKAGAPSITSRRSVLKVGMRLQAADGSRPAIRLLWVDRPSDLVYGLSAEKGSWPKPHSHAHLIELLLAGALVAAVESDADPQLAQKVAAINSKQHRTAEVLERASKQLKKKVVLANAAMSPNWDQIKDIVSHEPEVYEPVARAKLIRLAMKKHGISKPTIYARLRRYWESGKSRAAVESNYHLSGGKGKTRAVTEAGGKKRGRPKLNAQGEAINFGLNITEEHKRWIVKFAKKASLTKTLAECYNDMLKKHFAIKSRRKGDKIRFVPTSQRISMRQFRYWADRLTRFEGRMRRKIGDQMFTLSMRGQMGGIVQLAFGPGHRYEIDSTPLDVYVVNRLNRNYALRRPTLYCVTDRFSDLIAGIHVCLDEPSYENAAQALSNAILDKVEFCASWGITISHEDWPAEGAPAEAIADGGELNSGKADGAVKSLKLDVSILPACRGDWKSQVEQEFDAIQKDAIKSLPGAVVKQNRERGGPSPAQQAVLDFHQLMQLVIRWVLYRNNDRLLKTLPEGRLLREEMTTATAREVWNWGGANLTGRLTAWPAQLVKLALLPIATAHVTRKGVMFNGRPYTSERVVREGWAARARSNRRWTIDVRHDPRHIEEIIWINPHGEPEGMKLDDENRLYVDYIDEEITSLDKVRESEMTERRETQEREGRTRLREFAENLVRDARRDLKEEKGHKPSRSGRTTGMKDQKTLARKESRSRAAKEAVDSALGRTPKLKASPGAPKPKPVPAPSTFVPAHERAGQELLAAQRESMRKRGSW